MPPLPNTLPLPPSPTPTNHISNSQLRLKPKTPNSKTLHFPISLPPKPLKKPKPPPKTSDFQDKMLFLDSIGIDLFALIPLHPQLISTQSSELKSLISFLRSAASLSSADLRRIAAMCPDILSLKVSDIVPVFTFLLREAGVSGSRLRHVIHRRPRLLACDVKTRLRPTLYFLQGNIGISETSKCTFLLSCSVEDKFVPRIEYFRKMGLSEIDVKRVFRRFPALFCYGIEENLERKFGYFRGEMGRGLEEIVEFPQYFSFSLENRIKPRHRKCVKKGVNLSLPMMLKSSEQRFLDRLEVCCDSSMPVRTSPLWDINYDYGGVL